MSSERSCWSRVLRCGVAGLLWLLTGAALAETAPGVPLPAAASPPTASAPAAPGTAPVQAIETGATSSAGRRRVYVCEDAGVPMYSDRPCGTALAPRSLSFPVAPPGAAASTLPPPPRAGTRPRPQPVAARGPGDTTAQRCATLERQLEELDHRMRAGYSAREAARLWDRRRDLKNRLRAERC